MTASCPHYGSSTSSNFSSSISICKAGLRSIIFWSIICGVSSIRRKSAMSRPWLRCSSVAIVSNMSLTDTERQTLFSMGSLPCHSCVAPRSGISITSLPAKTWMARSLKQPFLPPVAIHNTSGMKWEAMTAVFSLSTTKTFLSGYKVRRCSPKKHWRRW